MSSQALRCTGLVVLLSALAAAPSDTQTFEAKTSVLVVELPMQVLASGRPVRALTRENFELYDAGERQEILSFEVLDLSAEPVGDDDDPVLSENRIVLHRLPREWVTCG
jgi:hypothetical protein